MILTMWMFVFLISIVFLVIGFGWKVDAFKIAGFTFMFLNGMVMLTNQLQYETSTNITTVGSAYVVTPVYTTYNDHFVSYLFTIVSIAGFIFTMVDRRDKQRRIEDDE